MFALKKWKVSKCFWCCLLVVVVIFFGGGVLHDGITVMDQKRRQEKLFFCSSLSVQVKLAFIQATKNGTL